MSHLTTEILSPVYKPQNTHILPFSLPKSRAFHFFSKRFCQTKLQKTNCNGDLLINKSVINTGAYRTLSN